MNVHIELDSAEIKGEASDHKQCDYPHTCMPYTLGMIPLKAVRFLHHHSTYMWLILRKSTDNQLLYHTE